MKQTNFESWETQDLEITFGLKQIWESEMLTEWLNAQTKFEDFEKKYIEKLRTRILHFVDFWNEDELKMQAISRILDFADYSSDEYSIFSQRPLSAVINDIELSGRVDFMLAKGRQKPISPYFFIHEYKQERKGNADPKGQLLAELLAAQAANENKFPLYGCYVVGRNWFFMILDGEKYAVSNALNSSDEDIYQIIAILKKMKTYIEAWL
jgi:hypothetical protein